MKKNFILLLVTMCVFALSSCGSDEPSNPINPSPKDPSTNTTDVAVSGTVEETGAFHAVINGVVNLDAITASYSTVEIGVEWSTSDLFSTKQRVEASGVTGRKFRVRVIPLLPNTKYYYRTYVSISSLSYDYYGETYSLTTKKMTESDKIVDLGLPSGTLWAAMNVGANSIEGYGDYFAWGETSPKSSYTSDNYMGNDITSAELPAGRDAATANWGSDWQMPSLDQIKELISECNWQRTALNGINGRLATSKRNGNFIFLPAAGCRYGSSLSGAASGGIYWSRTLGTGSSNIACSLFFESSDVHWYYFDRYYGQSVRAVRVSQN
ncbi:MAG: hypothetical protein II752_09765 [Muribaculaceae bacterium]|nr:hypothetical protein [Muribaculaceae bacterium]